MQMHDNIIKDNEGPRTCSTMKEIEREVITRCTVRPWMGSRTGKT